MAHSFGVFDAAGTHACSLSPPLRQEILSIGVFVFHFSDTHMPSLLSSGGNSFQSTFTRSFLDLV